MDLRVLIHVAGIGDLERRLGSVTKRFGDLREFWREELSPMLSREWEIMHALESGPDGPWVQLADATIEDRLRRGYPGAHPILWRTGEGFRSLIDPKHSDAIEIIDRDKYVRGTARDYMGAHESGTSHMPARRWYPSEGFWEEVEERLADFVVKPLEKR